MYQRKPRIKCLLITDGIMQRRYTDNKRFYTKNTFLLFATALSKHFETLTLFVPIKYRKEIFGNSGLFELKIVGNLKIVNSGNFSSVVEYYRKLYFLYGKNKQKLKTLISEHDIIMVRLPSMNAFLLSEIIINCKKAFCTYVVGDQEVIVESGGKYTGLLRALGKKIAGFHAKRTIQLTSKANCSIFLGKNLLDKYGKKCNNPRIMFTSLVKRQDIVSKKIDLWPPDPMTILFVGRLEYEKGVNTLLTALSILLEQKMNVELLICGTGSAEIKLKLKAKELGIENKIQFLGFVKLHPDLDEYFLKSDLFVLPSISEGIPKVLLEAMAKGVPIVATAVGGVTEIITDEKNGILIPPQNNKGLINAITRVYADKNLAEKIQKGGYEFIKDNTMDKQAAKISGIVIQSYKQWGE